MIAPYRKGAKIGLFGAAGVGMVLGLIQFRLTAKHLGEAGLHPIAHDKGGTISPEAHRKPWMAVWACVAIIPAGVFAGLPGLFSFNPVALAKSSANLILGIAAIYTAFNSLDYATVFGLAPSMVNEVFQVFPGVDWSLMSVVCILLFNGAMGTSAQVPLHVWLPYSLEGPPPIYA